MLLVNKGVNSQLFFAIDCFLYAIIDPYSQLLYFCVTSCFLESLNISIDGSKNDFLFSISKINIESLASAHTVKHFC